SRRARRDRAPVRGRHPHLRPGDRRLPDHQRVADGRRVHLRSGSGGVHPGGDARACGDGYHLDRRRSRVGRGGRSGALMSKKQKDLLKAKQKKQKVIVAVGGVLLLAILAFQVPRMMKSMNQLNGSASSSSSAATTTASTTPAPTGTPPADGS